MKRILKTKHFNFSLKRSFHNEKFFEIEDKTGLTFSLEDKPGILLEALKIFSTHNINLSFINSKPSKYITGRSKYIDFFVDIEGSINDNNIKEAINKLSQMSKKLDISKVDQIPWFPKSIYDLNKMGRTLMSAGEHLSSDHPGFNDEVYRKRREEIVNISNSYNIEDGINIPEVKYTDQETKLWSFMWDQLIPLHKKHACIEFNKSLEEFIKEAGFRKDKIPQIKVISEFLMKKTNTIYRPVGGLLTQREFLNGLAFRVFHSTQYIRHHSAPLYTPEPDIIHEILGHAPLFANKDFADFSQELGLASLAASDEDIARLGTIYWFTVEFGLCMQEGERKIYGAGILSSPSEIKWATSDDPRFHEMNVFKVALQPYTITEIQKDYFLAPSFAEMKKEVQNYAENIKRPFNLSYNIEKMSIEVDRKIITRKETSNLSNDKLF